MQKTMNLALSVCPEAVRRCVQVMPEDVSKKIEELRFRLGQSVMVLFDSKEQPLMCPKVSRQWLEQILGAATGQAVYASQETLKSGFVTLQGGHRLGICGKAVYQNGSIYTLTELSSLNLRLARQINGIATNVADHLWLRPRSTLIIGPPGRGKTTLLRDLIRQLSNRFGCRISVADERMELAACYQGEPCFDLGPHTDILTGMKKAEAISLLLRTMNPQWIAVDEITAPEDVESMLQASYCGVLFLATAHASCLEELRSRPLYQKLLAGGIFQNLISILPDRSVKKEGLTTNA